LRTGTIYGFLLLQPSQPATGDQKTEKDVSAKKTPENITLAGKPKCYQCGKDAIGVQSIGCPYLNVCEDHANSHIFALKPGEKQSVGESFFFKRFDTDDS